MDKNSKIFVAGHNGLVGSAIVRNLKSKGYGNLLTIKSSTLDLRNQESVKDFFNYHRPEYIFLAAAKVGGILDNATYPADYIYDNLMIQNNVINFSHVYKVKKLLFLGSSCIYPKFAQQPIKEEYLLSDYLEQSNEAYAIAKISGMKMCEYYNKQYGSNFISCMPTNLYGPNDNFDLNSSHVIPALINKFINAKDEVICWGDGSAKREFLYVDDMAEGCIFLMNEYNNNQFLNLGTGEDISIKELVELIARLTKFKGKIVWDTSKPNGTPRKVLDVFKINKLGWKASTTLEEGLVKTLKWYKNNSSL
jgi:GDP-L-fucose synthase